MPIHEYRCNRCYYRFDALQEICSTPLKSCPECYENSLERLISAPVVHVRGPSKSLPDEAADLTGEGARNFFGLRQPSGVHSISRVGKNWVIHPNLIAPPPGSFGMHGVVDWICTTRPNKSSD